MASANGNDGAGELIRPPTPARPRVSAAAPPG